MDNVYKQANVNIATRSWTNYNRELFKSPARLQVIISKCDYLALFSFVILFSNVKVLLIEPNMTAKVSKIQNAAIK